MSGKVEENRIVWGVSLDAMDAALVIIFGQMNGNFMEIACKTLKYCTG